MTMKKKGLVISGEIDSDLSPVSVPISPPETLIDGGKDCGPTSLFRGKRVSERRLSRGLLRSLPDNPFSVRFPVGTKVKTLFRLGTGENSIERGVIATVFGSDKKGIWITYNRINIRTTLETVAIVHDQQWVPTPFKITLICGVIFLILMICGATFPIAFLLSICITGIFVLY